MRLVKFILLFSFIFGMYNSYALGKDLFSAKEKKQLTYFKSFAYRMTLHHKIIKTDSERRIAAILKFLRKELIKKEVEGYKRGDWRKIYLKDENRMNNIFIDKIIKEATNE